MKNKPVLLDKKSVVLQGVCKFGKDVILHNNVFLKNCEIGDNCEIFPFCEISDSKIGKNSKIYSSVIEKSVVGANNIIGPFAHLRPDSQTQENVKIGNFVEVKNSVLENGVKANHLAYIGDAYIGENSNIGCGVIFVNYNGKIKQKSIVGKNCFIGSNVNVIAPINIADGSYICAGSTVTDDTNPNDFVIGRVLPTIKSNKAIKYIKGDK